MKVDESLDLSKAKKVIQKLTENKEKKFFSSRDFIRRYFKENNKEYVSNLSICNSNPRILHSLMARCLARHCKDLNIVKEKGKRNGENDPTCYGNKAKVQGWRFEN